MKIAVSGGTGMIGRALVAELRARGDEVLVLTRQEPSHPGQVHWDQSRGVHDLRRLEGTEALVNLVGSPVATRPWTRSRRQELWDGRIHSIRSIASSFRKADCDLSVVVGPSVLGRFGDRGLRDLDDDAEPGEGFLAELAVGWEDAHLEAAELLKARGVVLRMGVVLDAREQTFPLMLQPFRLGLGGWLGDGEQVVCWVTTRDAVAGFVHAIDTPSLLGGCNHTVPEPVSFRAWTESLGRAVGRQIRTRAPSWVLRGAFGEYANDLLLASIRARPNKLVASGFEYQDPDAERAFRRLLAERQLA